ncbi:MAG: TRAP transporter substrate-binding protein [Spirochaetaceae bacterium]|jgi:tripartite ATP-independent transporter DctP family solute receptor|nr:TRAP transporter substrate-binding protein [Spirochaetaceae bacterium]
MKKLLVTIVLITLTLSSVLAEGQKDSSEKTYSITAGIGLNDKSAQYEPLISFKELVQKNSNGRITVDVYHSSQLGDDREMMEALQRGEQEITCPSTAPIITFNPEYGVFDLPFLFPTAESADYVLDGKIGQELLDSLSLVGIKGLAFWENGYRNLTNSVQAVYSPEDAEGLKIRTMENPMHLDAWIALGANPTPMAFGELFSAMQQGVVDGQENPWGTIYLQSFYEVQSFATDTGHVYSPFVLMIAQKFFDDLPSDLQKVVEDAAIRSKDKNRELNRRYNREYKEKLKDLMTVVELTPEQKAEFQKAVMPVYDTYAKAIGQDVIDGVLSEIKKFNSNN